jgi:hypothetical protein
VVGYRLSGLEAPEHGWKAKMNCMEIKIDIVPKIAVSGLSPGEDKVPCFTSHDPYANITGSMLRIKTTDLCQA